ncbi:hypothetical protein AC578_4005 [Pseudocercospora eumusae]|uniref:Uncharacterized protein n=1 Tax=Pseudocercospora eumusae TaxID=321146 RepID=A0A139HLS6_9PEZI|nr:hypothetical protein AC578_4005 [Pseudocercospora eumusae]
MNTALAAESGVPAERLEVFLSSGATDFAGVGVRDDGLASDVDDAFWSGEGFVVDLVLGEGLEVLAKCLMGCVSAVDSLPHRTQLQLNRQFRNTLAHIYYSNPNFIIVHYNDIKKCVITLSPNS